MKVLLVKFFYYIILIFGSSLSLFLVIGLFIDLRGIDKDTRSTKFELQEVVILSDSFIFEKIMDGVIKHGIMSDYRIDCSSGIIRLKIHGGRKLDYSLLLKGGFYKEILQKYTLGEACVANGHSPKF